MTTINTITSTILVLLLQRKIKSNSIHQLYLLYAEYPVSLADMHTSKQMMHIVTMQKSHISLRIIRFLDYPPYSNLKNYRTTFLKLDMDFHLISLLFLSFRSVHALSQLILILNFSCNLSLTKPGFR